MKFSISGDFAGLPELVLDGEVINYRSLDVLCFPETEFVNSEGATVKLPASCQITFSVKETIGNLEVDKYYRAKASKDGTDTLIDVTELVKAEKAEKGMLGVSEKTCAKCGKTLSKCKDIGKCKEPTMADILEKTVVSPDVGSKQYSINKRKLFIDALKNV